ncbi:hypothetical protein ZIOFF_055158 [Zingiber officinale]|uniref:Disease resistance R13L4/SHOC-2-like LRR domain-containing protein n=1 Tax=Zingiber officinale TaxID=94328 RepID=A0A8J5FVS7_ZINOF|nr:hypothetical protein ZIOFF_055158 [Zingiber officinale]
MIRNSPWTTNSFLLDATLSAVEQPDVAEWMKDVGVTLEDVDSLLERILDYWKPNKEDEGKKNRKMMSNFLSMSSRQAILVELKEMACLLNCQLKENDIFSARNCLEDIQIDVLMKICSKYWLQKALCLNLAENKIETLPESLCNLHYLCVLNLSSCKKLKELPRQIHKLRNLQILKLSCCLRIQKLPKSITCLVNLKELDVGDCCYLSKLPDDLSDMKNLMQLEMHGCASLTIMPIGIRQLINLEVLWGYDAIDGLGNVMLPELQDLTNFEYLHIQHLERIELAEEKNITPPTNLPENQCLNELMLHSEWWNDMVAEGTLEPTMLLTQGFQHNLRDLKMVSYMSDKFPSCPMMTEGDPQLVFLILDHEQFHGVERSNLLQPYPLHKQNI